MAISENQVSPNKELYAYNPSNRFRIYERNISRVIYYKFFPDTFKKKVCETLKNLKIPLEIIENATGWIRVIVPDEHKDNPQIKDMVSNIGTLDMDEYYKKKMKMYASKGWQVVVRDI